MSLKEEIKHQAQILGFSSVGIANADYDPICHDRFLRWLAKGHHADMKYMERDVRRRFDPHLHIPSARSVIVCALNYYTEPQNQPDRGYVSIYARSDNYHSVVKEKLENLATAIRSLVGHFIYKSTVDSSAISEKSLAIKAGLGFMGKNGTVILHEKGAVERVAATGSFHFLGVIISDLELEVDSAVDISCGDCRSCIDACPTGAIVDDSVIDCRKCITYHTKVNKGDIPDDVSSAMGNIIFCCDICQLVCPHNRNATPTSESRLAPYPNLVNADFSTLSRISEQEFESRYSRSSLGEINYLMFQRNVAAAERNVRLREHPDQAPA